MWQNHTFSQRNKTTKTAIGVEVGDDRVVEQNLKMGGMQNRGVSIK